MLARPPKALQYGELTMTNSSVPRFIVRQDTGDHWIVWDSQLNQPAELKSEKLIGLALSAAEALRDTLNADHGA